MLLTLFPISVSSLTTFSHFELNVLSQSYLIILKSMLFPKSHRFIILHINTHLNMFNDVFLKPLHTILKKFCSYSFSTKFFSYKTSD